MESSNDRVLSDLARRVLNRDLFEYSSKARKDELDRKCSLRRIESKYYLVVDHQSQAPYLPYTGNNTAQCIWMLTSEGIKELSEVSDVVASLSYIDEQDERIFYPREIEE